MNQSRGSVAWFGLGRFGLPMATHLRRSGYTVLIGDDTRAPTSVEVLKRLGARALEPGAKVDAYAACVPQPSDVE